MRVNPNLQRAFSGWCQVCDLCSALGSYFSCPTPLLNLDSMVCRIGRQKIFWQYYGGSQSDDLPVGRTMAQWIRAIQLAPVAVSCNFWRSLAFAQVDSLIILQPTALHTTWSGSFLAETNRYNGVRIILPILSWYYNNTTKFYLLPFQPLQLAKETPTCDAHESSQAAC